MSRTEKLLALAEAATPGSWECHESVIDCGPEQRLHYKKWKAFIECYGSEDDPANGKVVSESNAAFIAAANPETIKQLVELAVLQHEALKWTSPRWPEGTPAGDALAAFERFEKVGE